MSNYDWDKNCAVVDRMFYWEYFLRGTTFTALLLSAKDLFFIKQNWYVDRARRRLPIVIIYFNNFVKKKAKKILKTNFIKCFRNK
jgi:hypothetical protein